jgi:hypothetical protein
MARRKARAKGEQEVARMDRSQRYSVTRFGEQASEALRLARCGEVVEIASRGQAIALLMSANEGRFRMPRNPHATVGLIEPIVVPGGFSDIVDDRGR